jgi:hypothetical protein
MLVVLNQVDLIPAGAGPARDDLQGLLAGAGLRDVPVLAVSARTGEGTGALREAIAERVRSREAALARLAADVGASAAALRAQAGDGRASGVERRERAELTAALGAAAGVPAVVAAVGAAHRHRGTLATGLPWAAWLRRLRPDPLRRLGIGDAPQADVRTSLPRATPVQRAQVDSAIRSVAADVAGGLPEPWPTLARRAALTRDAELADRLDRAIAGAELRVRPPRWWTPVRWLQRLLAAVALAGALWLVLLAGLGWLQLGDVLPTPDLLGVPAPTLLLAGGLAAGLVLGLLARIVNRLGARRRAARARRVLEARIREVADELVVAPLEAELAAHDELAKALHVAVR